MQKWNFLQFSAPMNVEVEGASQRIFLSRERFFFMDKNSFLLLEPEKSSAYHSRY